MEFFICAHCGNVVAFLEEKGVKITCCGEEVRLFKPNVVDAAVEKHVPVVEVNDHTVTVTVSNVLHPMSEDHYISWIVLHSEQGNQRKIISRTGEPKAVFALTDEDRPVTAYACCNLHGLWKS